MTDQKTFFTHFRKEKAHFTISTQKQLWHLGNVLLCLALTWRQTESSEDKLATLQVKDFEDQTRSPGTSAENPLELPFSCWNQWRFLAPWSQTHSPLLAELHLAWDPCGNDLGLLPNLAFGSCFESKVSFPCLTLVCLDCNPTHLCECFAKRIIPFSHIGFYNNMVQPSRLSSLLALQQINMSPPKRIWALCMCLVYLGGGSKYPKWNCFRISIHNTWYFCCVY